MDHLPPDVASGGHLPPDHVRDDSSHLPVGWMDDSKAKKRAKEKARLKRKRIKVAMDQKRSLQVESCASVDTAAVDTSFDAVSSMVIAPVDAGFVAVVSSGAVPNCLDEASSHSVTPADVKDSRSFLQSSGCGNAQFASSSGSCHVSEDELDVLLVSVLDNFDSVCSPPSNMEASFTELVRELILDSALEQLDEIPFGFPDCDDPPVLPFDSAPWDVLLLTSGIKRVASHVLGFVLAKWLIYFIRAYFFREIKRIWRLQETIRNETNRRANVNRRQWHLELETQAAQRRGEKEARRKNFVSQSMFFEMTAKQAHERKEYLRAVALRAPVDAKEKEWRTSKEFLEQKKQKEIQAMIVRRHIAERADCRSARSMKKTIGKRKKNLGKKKF